jgi:hypothetical protein
MLLTTAAVVAVQRCPLLRPRSCTCQFPCLKPLNAVTLSKMTPNCTSGPRQTGRASYRRHFRAQRSHLSKMAPNCTLGSALKRPGFVQASLRGLTAYRLTAAYRLYLKYGVWLLLLSLLCCRARLLAERIVVGEIRYIQEFSLSLLEVLHAVRAVLAKC